MSLPKIDIDQPKFDQSTYMGRVKHFFLLTNPLNLLASNASLDRAQRIVLNYRAGRDVSNEGVESVEDLWRAKYLYDSAFHPETGEKSIIIGRMSAQMPANTILTGCLLAFHKTTLAVVFWQWVNQTYMATVNFTNRSGSSPITSTVLATSYVFATGGALTTALTLNSLVANMNPLIGRFVPLVAVAAANCINIPTMRQHELINGVSLYDEKNREVGVSRKAAFMGISAVVASRVAMCVPGMTLTPFLVEYLERQGFLKRYPKWSAPIQTLFCGVLYIFTTPMGCAFFKQKATAKVSSLEPDVQEAIRKKYPDLKEVWYNKGL